MTGSLREWMTTRRRLALGGAAVAAAAVVGTAWFAFASPKDLIFVLLQRALPGVRLDRSSVDICAEKVLAEIDSTFEGSLIARTASMVKLKGVRALAQVLGIERVASIGPFEQRLAEITRMAITEFLPHSNFFHVADPRAETIYYAAPERNAACGNPFADLSPPV